MTTPWVSAETILKDQAFCSLDIEDEVLIGEAYDAAIDASSILYVMSGRSLSGPRTVTVWPHTTEAFDWTLRMTGREALDWTLRQTGREKVVLEWPVISVDEVVAEGVTLTAGDDYVVMDNRYLVRTPNAQGQVRYWPMSWVNDHQFSITYTFGLDIPGWAVDAARELGVSLLRQRKQLGSPLPAGVSSVSQQGMSYSINTQAQMLREGLTTETFPSVVRFLSLVNPDNERMQTFAWSPDLGHELHRVTYDG